MVSRRKKWLRLFLLTIAAAVALLAALVCYVFFIEPLPNKRERALITSITTHLKEPGDWVMLSEIHPGTWTQVCVHPSMSLSGTLTREILANKFGVSDLRFPNGIASSSDGQWVLMFFYPPNTLDMFTVPTKALFASVSMKDRDEQLPGCRTKNEAVFFNKRIAQDRYPQEIFLTTSDEMKEKDID